MNKETFFKFITEEIHNKKILRILNSVKIPDYFWEIPSSSSGRYHPKDEIKKGGVVLHTLKDCKVARMMFPMENFTKNEEEIILASLLLHDTYKSGVSNTGKTVFEHPLLAAQEVLRVCPTGVGKKIASAIASHMGKWNTRADSAYVLPKPRTKIEKFVHICDYIASRKQIKIRIGKKGK